MKISKDQTPIELETYLGALGHSVILKERSLDYIHTHAEGGDHNEHGSGSPSEISFFTEFPLEGKYKIYTQFQHEGKVMTTVYVVEVK